MTTLSGWCLRPYSEFSKDQHDGCPKEFATGGSCSCDCSHPAAKERSELVEGRDWPASWHAALTGKRSAVPVAESESAEVLDKPAQEVYAERVPTTGGAEALRKLHKGESNGSQSTSPEPEHTEVS